MSGLKESSGSCRRVPVRSLCHGSRPQPEEASSAPKLADVTPCARAPISLGLSRDLELGSTLWGVEEIKIGLGTTPRSKILVSFDQSGRPHKKTLLRLRARSKDGRSVARIGRGRSVSVASAGCADS